MIIMLSLNGKSKTHLSRVFAKSCTLLYFIFLWSFVAHSQVPTITATESKCVKDGSVTVTGDPIFFNLLTGSNIPGQLGPLIGGTVTFTELPKGTYTLTQIDPKTNAEKACTITVPGNYEQNWFFEAKVLYTPCSGGTPTVKIGNFVIKDALVTEQRPPYMYRISAKDGMLPGDGSIPPNFQPVTEFAIPFPAGLGGSYEIQSMDACGNFKTFTINVPASAPGPATSASFVQFNNCDGDADYKLSATGGTAPYVFTVKSGPNQVGTSKTGADATFTLTAGGTYVITAIDQCGGKTDQTVVVKPYSAPDVNLWNGYGKCDANGASTGSIAVNVDLNTVSKGPVTVTLLSALGCTQVTPLNYPLDGSINQVTFDNLKRPCNYTIQVTDGCGKVFTRDVSLVGPGPRVLECYKSIECPRDNSTNYTLKLGTFGNQYTATPPLKYEIIDSTTKANVAGYPTEFQVYTEVFPQLSKGKYYIKITDACGATCIDSVSVPQYIPPTVSVSSTGKCFGAGQANVIGINNQSIDYLKAYNYKIESGPTRVGAGPESDSPTNTGQFSGLESGGTYTFSFNDGCKTVTTTVTMPQYVQPTWEVGFGALCSPNKTANLQAINLQPEGQVVGPYKWRIINTNSDLYGSTSPYNGTLPFPSNAGQTDSTFANLPAKADGTTATYTILGFDACKNSYQGTGKVGPLPEQDLILSLTKVCSDGSSILRARVTIPVVGATYRYYRNGVVVAESKKLFTTISPALPGVYTVKVIASTLPDSSCFKSSPPTGITVEAVGGIKVTTPATSCSDVPVDLNTTVTGSTAGTFTFYKDKAMTQVVTSPVSVAQTYYIKLVTSTAPTCTIKDSVKITFKNCKPLGSIGDFVWLDNGDNVQGPGDSPVSGVTVYLLNASGAIIDTTTTGNDGKYLFTNLPAGTYSVQFVAPTGQQFVTATQGGNPATDSDAGAGGKSGQITLAPVLNPTTAADSANTFNFTLDAGLKRLTVPIFDLSIRKSLVGTGPFKAGDNVTFNVTVFNQGAAPAFNVEVTDYLPAGMTLNDAAWTASGANASRILAGPIAPNSSVQVPITLKIDAAFEGSNLTNVAEITKADDDTNPNNTPPTDIDSTPGNKVPGEDDQDSTPIPFQPAPPTTPVFDLALSKKVIGSGPYKLGDLVAFDITVFNQGSVAAFNVEVTDYIPTGFVLSDATWTANGSGVKKTIAGPIAVGGSASTTITLKIDPAFAGTKIVNVAEITKADDDTNPNNTPPTDKDSTPGNKVPTEDDQDQDIIELTPIKTTTPFFDLALVKKHTGLTPYAVGDTVTFTLAVINQGSQVAFNVEVTDYLPVGMSLVDATWTAGGTNATRVIAGPIAVGTTQFTTIKLRIDPSFTGSSLTNVAEISKADNDTDGSNAAPVDVDGVYDNNTNNNGPVKDDVTNEDNKTNPTTDDLDSSDPDKIGVTPKKTALGSIGDFVFFDNDGSNTQTSGDTPVAGVVVNLLDGTGAVIATTTTGTDGKYLFANLPLGTYSVQFVAPARQSFVTSTQGGDTSLDSDAGTDGKSAQVTLTATTPDVMTLDAGIKKLTIDENCVQTPPSSVLGPNVFVCKGQPYTQLQAMVMGTGTVDWYKTATSTIALATGTLTYTPMGNVAANDTFYIAARSTLPNSANCPTVSERTRVIVVAQACSDTVDLALKKLISKKMAKVGDEITYTVKVWNQSSTNATGVAVADSLNAGIQYITSSASRGNYDIATKQWTIGNIAANGDTVTLTMRVKVLSEGVWFNTAQISSADQKDKDSTPGNNVDTEDDIDSRCFSVPFKLCVGQGQGVMASVPSKYTGVVWRDGQGNVVPTNNGVVTLTKAGTYTFTATNGTCPAEGCCPVIVEDINCCPADLCVPFTINKKKR